MGGALLKGWIARKIGPVIVVEPKPSPELRKLAKNKTITLVDAPSQVKAKKLSACVVALKPQILKGEAPVLADFARSGALMISIAAGTHTKSLFQAWGAKARIIRAMPNTPGAIGQGITGLFAARGATAADKRKATALLAALGETIWVTKEDLIDSVTAVSGSGPAYLFLMAEAMTEAGIAEGLPRDAGRETGPRHGGGRGRVAGGGQIARRGLARSRHQPGRHDPGGAECADGRGRAGGADETRHPCGAAAGGRAALTVSSHHGRA